ncbi:MAG TPA: hypothetical protein DEB06_02595 [Phycisphaerales bacterium]|nr:hypothetical protein [Phycisphaerales bacterium]
MLDAPGSRGRTFAAHAERRNAGGFTLLETALTTVILGVGVLAVMEAQQTFIVRNSWSTSASTAAYLAEEVREMSKTYTRHDRFTGGLYYLDDADPDTLAGWGPEAGETEADDFDDLDDLDGAVFGNATTFPDGFTMTRRLTGPINSFGVVIPETRYDGTTETIVLPAGGDPVPVAMRGWTQIVTVEKVNPYDISEVVPDNEDERDGATVLRAVDRYPLRLTVVVLWQPDAAAAAVENARVSWVVFP